MRDVAMDMTEKAGSMPTPRAAGRPPASLLQYYIHDGAQDFRFQLIGELTETDLPDLSGCWCTAKSSVAGKKIILDVHGLLAVDEAGRQWIASMTREGATLKAKPGFAELLMGDGPERVSARNSLAANPFRRLLGLLGLPCAATQPTHLP